MKRLSDDSDDDETYRQLSSLVFSPAITSLPSIQDEVDSDGGDSSCETEFVFSNINWAAQENAGLLFDQELTSPGPPGREKVVYNSDARHVGVHNSTLSTQRPALKPTVEVQRRGARAGPSSSSAAAVGPPGPPSRSPTAETQSSPRDCGIGPLHAADLNEPYEGRGWLAGAAGRLANTAERRQPHAAATDAEQVAAAAIHAAALQQHRQQQQQQRLNQPPQQLMRKEGDAVVGIAPGPGVPRSDAVLPHGVAGNGQQRVLLQQQQQQQQECEEMEMRILQDFQDALRAAESEPQLVAPGGLSLESTVAGLAVEDLDLDSLIARLAAGTADLRPWESQCLGEAAAGAAGAAGAEVRSGDGTSSNLWSVGPLPTAASLWSDDEEDSAQEECLDGVTLEHESDLLASTGSGRGAAQVKRLSSTASQQVAEAASTPAAVGMVTPGNMIAAAGAHQPHLLGPLPAKFKFFAGPHAAAMVAPQKQQQQVGTSTATTAAVSSGPVVQDLRQSIANVVQHNICDAAAAAAQRQSQAKVAGAMRRVVNSSSDSSSDGEIESEDEDSKVVKKVRPLPPAPAVQLAPAPQPAVHATLPPPSASTANTAAAATIVTAVVTPTSPLAAKISGTAHPDIFGISKESASLRQASSDDTVLPQRVGIGAGGASAAAPAPQRSTSVGTDSADLRPSSRSMFVCTSMQEEEDEERTQDIREYLMARAAKLKAEAEQLEHQQPKSAKLVEQRRWPDSPAVVTARIAAISERHAAAEAAPPLSSKPAAMCAIATFGGGGDTAQKSTNGAVGESDGTPACTNGRDGFQSTPLAVGAATPHVPIATASFAFAACSTEGDEDLVAEPLPESVMDAKVELGSRMAAAGTVIPLIRTPPAPGGITSISSTITSSLSSCDNSVAGTSSKSRLSKSACAGLVDHVGHAGTPVLPVLASVSAVADFADASPARGACGTAVVTEFTRDAPSVAVPTRPSALQLIVPASTPAAESGHDAPTSATAFVSPGAHSLSSAAASPAVVKSSSAVTAPADLCRLPAWLSPSSCFTLLLTSPGNLTSQEVGAILEWLLMWAARVTVTAATEANAAPMNLPPSFSVVGARLLSVPVSWPQLPSSPAAAFVARDPVWASGGVDVRVLAVACVPRAGVDADVYSHELSLTAAANVASTAEGARRLMEALVAVPWSAILQSGPPVNDSDGTFAVGGQAPHSLLEPRDQDCATLSGWVSIQPGGQSYFSPLRLPPHGFSQPRAIGSGSAISPGGSPGKQMQTTAIGAAVAMRTAEDPPGVTTFVCMVTAGVLRSPPLLRSLLQRAAKLGLTLRALQVVYATEEGAAAVVASTPHRPLPFTGAAVMALSGRNEPLRRWQAALGPPSAHLACRTDPSSLHALYGGVARHITCSYDAATAARELAVFFTHVAAHGGNDLSPSSPAPSRSGRHLLKPPGRFSPLAVPFSAQKAHLTSKDTVESGLVCSSAQEAQWLALSMACALQQSRALWCLTYLLWCGYSLRGMILMRPPGSNQNVALPPVLVMEVTKEEAANQLPLLLTSVPKVPQDMVPMTAATASPLQQSTFAIQSLLSSDELRARLARSDVQGLPQVYAAEQLLVAAIGGSALDLADSDGFLGAGGIAESAENASALHLHHREDGIVVVALQAHPLQDAALLLAALTAHATDATSLAGSQSTPSPDRLELVACRYLRQVPSDVANCLAVLHPHHGTPAAAAVGATANSSGGMPRRASSQRLVISHPALLAVFHGPSAQARTMRWMATALHRLQQHGAGEPAAAAGTDGDTAWEALLSQFLRYNTPTAAAPLPLVAISSSQAAAKRALSYAFSPAQVFLDPGLHDGLQRPPLSAKMGAATAGASSSAVPVSSPLFQLLAGPEPLPAIVALDFPALHRNLLPRLLKQLRREGFVLHGAVTCQLQPGIAAAAMPSLSGQPAVILHVSRSNAVQHLRAMAAALTSVGTPPTAGGSTAAASGGSSGSGGLHTCATWCDAVALVAELWPQPQVGLDEQTAAVPAAGILACSGTASGAACVPTRRFVRPEGSRLLQLTAMVMVPSVPAEGEGTAPSLDWVRLADALDALHSEGFRLAAVRAAAAGPRDLAVLGRVSCRISPAQHHAIHASAAASAAPSFPAAAAAALPGCSQWPAATPPPSNIVILALARDSAVTTLQVLIDEASRVAGEGLRRNAASALGGVGGLAGRGPGRREAVTALAALAPCVSVAHTPAAAEQQITAVFVDVFGTGGVPLLQ